jgi:hypothetical protein
MPLAFLNPWFWLGAAALAIPLWLHLRRKRETRLLRFSALRFLEDQPPPRRGPVRLRDRLLFALRALVVLLVLAGFAWPYRRGAETAPARESRVYVLDNTLSRQAGRGFIRDRDRIIRELASAEAGLRVAVVELTSTPRTVVSFDDDRETALEKVKELKPSFQRGSYLGAFRQANALLSRTASDARRIVFLGDQQANQWTENTASPPFLHDVRVDCSKPPGPRLDNVALVEPRVRRTFMGDSSGVNLTATIAHVGAAVSANVVVRANGRIVHHRTVELKGQPEVVQIQTQWESDPGVWVRGSAGIEAGPDALPGDNTVYFALPPVTEGRIALLTQSPYVRMALSREVMRGRWGARILEPSRLDREIVADADADALCLESRYLQSGHARQLVQRYLSGGRGVLLLVDQVTPAARGFLTELGFEVDGGVDHFAGGEEGFQFVAYDHPILQPFRSADFGDLAEVRMSRYARLSSRQATPLLFSERGAPLLFESSRTAGKLYVAAFGLDREHTSWPIHTTFIPFLDLAFQAMRGNDTVPTACEPGQVVVVSFPPEASGGEAVLKDHERVVAAATIQNGKARLVIPDAPGIYTLARPGRSFGERLMAVNPSPKESQLVYTESPEPLGTWQIGLAGHGARGALTSDPGVRNPVLMPVILRQQWWWWMLLAGLIAILVEMILAGAGKEAA